MNEDKIIAKLLEHDEQLKDIREKMVTKDDYRKHTELLETIASTVKITRQEQIALADWVKRLDKKVEVHDKDIKKVKVQLKIA